MWVVILQHVSKRKSLSLSLSPQRPKQRSLHHHSEESRLLAAVWWWHSGGASLTLLSVCLCFARCSLTHLFVHLVLSAPSHTVSHYVVQKIDAQAIEEFYGLTSDISKNSESGYILFYQSREWLELDQWHRKRLNRMRPVCFFCFFYLTDPDSPSPQSSSPSSAMSDLSWRMCQSSSPAPAPGFPCSSSLSPLSLSICFSLSLSLYNLLLIF